MASIMKRGDSYSVRYKYKDHSGKPCEGWESFKTKKEAQERKITVEKELLDGTFLVPDTMTVEEMLYKWIPIQSTKHKWSPKTYTQSVAMVQNILRLDAIPKPDDTADAVALAICHGHSSGSQLSRLIAKAAENDGAMGKIYHKSDKR